MDDIYKLIGKRIREERIKAGLTQEELGALAGVHYSFLGYIERGKKRASLKTINRIAHALNTHISFLFKSLPGARPTKSYQLTQKLLPLLKDKKKEEQDLIISTLKTLTRKMKRKRK